VHTYINILYIYTHTHAHPYIHAYTRRWRQKQIDVKKKTIPSTPLKSGLLQSVIEPKAVETKKSPRCTTSLLWNPLRCVLSAYLRYVPVSKEA
jgi:hypothetical protein